MPWSCVVAFIRRSDEHLDWPNDVYTKGAALITEKAELFAKLLLLEIPEDKLSFSSGWIFKFMLHNDLQASENMNEFNGSYIYSPYFYYVFSLALLMLLLFSNCCIWRSCADPSAWGV